MFENASLENDSYTKLLAAQSGGRPAGPKSAILRRVSRIQLKSLALFFCLGGAGCIGGPKQAADPNAILQGELGPAGGAEPASPEAPASASLPARRAPSADERPATRAECALAARHVEQLGVDIAIDTERDPQKRAQIRTRRAAMLRAPDAERRIQQSTARCLQRETTRGEARCIARIQTPEDIDRCESEAH